MQHTGTKLTKVAHPCSNAYDKEQYITLLMTVTHQLCQYHTWGNHCYKKNIMLALEVCKT